MEERLLSQVGQLGLTAGLLVSLSPSLLRQRESSLRRISWNLSWIIENVAHVALVAVSIAALAIRLWQGGSGKQQLDIYVSGATICGSLGSLVASRYDAAPTSRALYSFLSCILWTLAYPLPSDGSKAIAAVIPALYFLGGMGVVGDAGAEEQLQNDRGTVHPFSKPPSTLSYLTVSWINPLLKHAASNNLQVTDIWDTDADLGVRHSLCEGELSKARSGLSSRPLPTSFVALVANSFSRLLLISAVLSLIEVAMLTIQPFIVQSLIQEREPYIIVEGALVTIIQGLCSFHALLLQRKIGMKIRSGLTALVCDKSVEHAQVGSISSDPSVLIEVDLFYVFTIIENINGIWSLPLQIFVSLGAVIYILGWKSVLAACCAALLTLPPLLLSLNFMAKGMTRVMAAKDTRLSLIKYTLNRIKHIKLFGWETVFQQKIDDARTREMKEVGRVVFSSASIVFFSNTLPILLVSVSFAWHLALGGGLPSSVVFPSLILFNNITRVATLSPQIILTYQGGTISYNRIRNFLMGMPDDNPDLHGAQYQSETHLGEISMENASFNRPGNYDDLGTAILNGCTFQAAPESLTVIRGVVGSGKSTFGRAILGEIKPTTGSVQVSGRIAYAPQKPFLINGSIRDNILFGLPFDGPWYEQVIEAVCLSSDFVTLQDGDSTLLEGTDTTLSGGQQSRVALARAIYSRRPLVVLDDPLAAVDVNVQRKIVENVLGIRGILKDRTRVVITSNKTLMKMANSVYTIANGTITLSEPTLLEEDSDCTPDSTEASIAEDLVKPDSIPKSPDAVHSVDLLASIPLTMAQGSQTRETDIELGPIPISVGGPETLADLGVVPVRLSTYTSYVKAGKPWAWPLVMLSAIICILFGIVAAFALQQVGQDFDTVGSSSKLTPYAICGVAGAVFSVVFILLAFFAGIIPASLSIHHRLMGGILMSRFSFFDTTPVGHILNRFTYDLNKVDGTVGSGLLTFIITGLLIIFSLLAIVVVTPSSALYLVPVIFIEAFLQSYYMHACRQLRRLEINARNPVLNVANEIKSGSAVILAYGQVEFFKQRVRDFIDQHVRVWMPFLCLNVWLQLRLHILTCTVGVLTAATLLYVDAPSSTLGLVMNFVIQVTGLLGGMVQILSNLEADLISFERVHRYTQNTPEDDSSSSLVDGQEVTLPSRPASTSSWPRDNSIEIENYSASYRSSTALCLQNINLSISSGEHIAVVGRTGAGKSSLALALMRAIDSSAVRPGSRIMIDGRNILADVSVSEVRSAISVIPQEPVVFTGTLRENLDPLNKRSDAELLDAILTCELPKALGISEDDSPLEYRVVDEGQRLSTGQAQLIAVARAISEKRRIIIVDEATASLDRGTAEFINHVMRRAFQSCTLISIAHHIGSLVDYDRIIVLDHGSVVEFDKPEKLLQNYNSLFSQLARDASIEY